MSAETNDEQAGSRKAGKLRVRFFNVALKNGIVMSTPAYEEKQAFMAHLIRAVETSNPEFAWIQFLFLRTNYSAGLVRLKNSIHRTKTAMEQPSMDLVSGQEHDRKELYRDYYRRAEARMKKIDEVVTQPTITISHPGHVGGRRTETPSTPFRSTTAPTNTTVLLCFSTRTRGCFLNSWTAGWSRTYPSTWTVTRSPGSSLLHSW